MYKPPADMPSSLGRWGERVLDGVAVVLYAPLADVPSSLEWGRPWVLAALAIVHEPGAPRRLAERDRLLAW